jgi:DUF4097 and DUF4098 domain-containing protein YvlB
MSAKFPTWLCASGALATLVLVSGSARADVIERSFDVSANGKLEIDSDVGSIDVRSHDVNTVQVRVERLTPRSEELQVDFSTEGSTIRVTGDLPSRGNGGNYKVRFDVTVPRSFELDVRTAGGSVSVDDLDGAVRAQTAGGSLDFGNMGGTVWARTAGGSIALRDSSGPADLNTAGGSIDVGNVGGEVRAKTAGGSIRVGHVNGSVDAHTSGGSIHVEEAVGPVRASTSGGSIRAYISQQPNGDSELETSGGEVTVILADGIALDVEADGGDGGVHSDFPIDGRTSSDHALDGRLNGGGPRLYLRSSDGVEIRKR